MATIVRTDSNTWKALVRKSGFPTASKTFRVKRDAEDWSRRLEDEMVRGIYVNRAPSERMTVDTALDRYLAEITPTKKPSTQESEQKKARVVRRELGKYSLAALTGDVISKFRDSRLKEGKSADTVRLEIALISHMFTIAMREWRLGITNNPVTLIRKPSAGKGRDRRLSAKEEKSLLAACDEYKNPMLGWIVRLGIETAMRKSSIKNLRLYQVDLHGRSIYLPMTMAKNGDAQTVPLSREAVRILRAAVANPLRPQDCDLVFFGEPGKDGRRRPYQFESGWDEVKKSIGIDDLRFHDLRHEATSRFVEGGLSDLEVASITNHKTMQMLKRYTHLRTKKLISKLDAIEREKRR